MRLGLSGPRAADFPAVRDRLSLAVAFVVFLERRDSFSEIVDAFFLRPREILLVDRLNFLFAFFKKADRPLNRRLAHVRNALPLSEHRCRWIAIASCSLRGSTL